MRCDKKCERWCSESISVKATITKCTRTQRAEGKKKKLCKIVNKEGNKISGNILACVRHIDMRWRRRRRRDVNVWQKVKTYFRMNGVELRRAERKRNVNDTGKSGRKTWKVLHKPPQSKRQWQHANEQSFESERVAVVITIGNFVVFSFFYRFFALFFPSWFSFLV